MAYLGTRASFTNSNGNWVSSNIEVYYDVSVDNSYSLIKSKITFTFTTTGTTKIWNHGVIVNVTCNGSTEPASITSGTSDKQDKDTILVGCKDGWAKVANYVSGGGASKSISFTVDKTSAAQSISYTVRAYNGYIANYTTNNGKTEHNDLRNQGLINSASGNATVNAKVTPSAPTIEDLGKNNFKITATRGGDTSAKLEWSGTTKDKDNDWYTSTGSYLSGTYTYPSKIFESNSTTQKVSLSDFTLDKRPTRKVWARTTIYGGNNSSLSSDSYADIIQYWAPTAPSNITITPTKDRLTIKAPWKVKWTEATPTNSSSPVKGYCIRIYKKSPIDTTFKTIKFYSKTTGALLSSDMGSGDDRYYYNRGVSKGTEMTMHPDIQGILPGDIIKIGMLAYTEYGNEDKDKLYNENQVYSPEYLVQNAGIVRVKATSNGVIKDDYKEGQVFIKVLNTGVIKNDWKEADIVKTKVSNTGNISNDWKESE